MADLVDPEHARAALSFRRLWAAYEENRDLVLMGAYVAGHDAVLDEAIVRRDEMLAYLRQSPSEILGLEASRAHLVGAFS
jgi:flagellum-specific ATP synthase